MRIVDDIIASLRDEPWTWSAKSNVVGSYRGATAGCYGMDISLWPICGYLCEIRGAVRPRLTLRDERRLRVAYNDWFRNLPLDGYKAPTA